MKLQKVLAWAGTREGKNDVLTAIAAAWALYSGGHKAGLW